MENERRPKLIYAHYGDIRALAVITGMHSQLNTRTKSSYLKFRTFDSLQGAQWWSGMISVKNKGDWPIAIAIIRPEQDTDEFLANLGFERADCLRLVGDQSTNRRSRGLMRLNATGAYNTAHLRDFNTYPLSGFERLVANQVAESFVINYRLRRRGHAYMNNWRGRPSGYAFVRTPRLRESLLAERAVG